MRRIIRIILEYLLAFAVIFLLLLAITGVVMVKFYGEDLKRHVMDQVNEKLESTVEVEEVSVQVFHNFPNTSILLEGVTIWSSHNFNPKAFAGPGADTLLTARTASASFNLFGLLRKKYNLKKLEIRQGQINLLTDQNGEGNYQLLNRTKGSQDRGRQIDLSQVKLIDFNVRLDNEAKQLRATGRVHLLELNAKFTKRTSQIKSVLEGALEEVSNKGVPYASHREVRSKINLALNDSLYTIRTGHFQLDRIVADVDGTFMPRAGEGVDLDLSASARDLEIHEVLDLFPNELSSGMSGIEGNGDMQLSARITGKASALLTPGIEGQFQATGANLKWKKRFPFILKNLDLKGSYTNGKGFSPLTTTLQLESFSCRIGDDRISGSATIHNFYEPDFSLELKGEIHPEQWTRWYDKLPVREAKGRMEVNMKTSGSYDRLREKGHRFLSFDLAGGISLDEVGFKFSGEAPPVAGLTGSLYIENDFWEPSFSGTYGKSQFKITGSGANLLSFLIKKSEPLVASASFRSRFLDLKEVLEHMPGSRSAGNSAVAFPRRLNLRMEFAVDELHKGPFQASNVRGVATYDPPLLLIDSLTMQTMEGTLRGELGMFQDEGGTVFTNVNAGLHRIDIHQLFYSFNNFGQQQITHENLNGILSGTSVFSATFDSTFRILPSTILSENNITIQDGQLKGYSPMLALSRFIEVEELENIRFETLENTILIRNSQVIIPSMEIHSNALNLSASGTHGFDNHFDYRLRLKMSELLYSKARSRGNTEFVMAEDASDSRILFLKILNDGNGTTVEMDRERTAEKIREGMKNEKQELKQILNRELGLFRKDSAVNIQTQQTEDQKEMFKFEFSDDPSEPPAENEAETGHRWIRRRRNEAVQKDSDQNKPAKEFVFDEEPD